MGSVAPSPDAFPLFAQLVQGALRGRLLGLLLAPPRSGADLLPVDRCEDLEATVVGRPLLADHLVVDRVAVAGQPLLQLGLEVEALPRRVLDLIAERLHHGPRGWLEAVREIGGADHRL